jgi:hypothetical protein
MSWNKQHYGMMFIYKIPRRREVGHNNLGLCKTSAITLYILWYQLIRHNARGLLPCLVRYKNMNVRYNDINGHHCQYNFARSKLLWEFNLLVVVERARPLLLKVAKFQTWNMKTVAVIVLTRTFRLTPLTEDWWNDNMVTVPNKRKVFWKKNIIDSTGIRTSDRPARSLVAIPTTLQGGILNLIELQCMKQNSYWFLERQYCFRKSPAALTVRKWLDYSEAHYELLWKVWR